VDDGNVTSAHSGRSTAAAEDGAASLDLTSGACTTVPCGGNFPGLYVLSDGAAGAIAGGWAVARVWARSSTADGAAQAVLIDQGSYITSSVSLVQSGAFTEYVPLGPVASTDVRARFQIVSSTQATTAYFDALHLGAATPPGPRSRVHVRVRAQTYPAVSPGSQRWVVPDREVWGYWLAP
jgi:hypothetical protein